MSAPRRSNPDWPTLIDEIEAVRGDMLRLVEESQDVLDEVHPDHQASARNFLHYLAFRMSQAGPSHAARSPDRHDLQEGRRLLDEHRESVIGPRPAGRTPAMMVTMPTAAAEDYTLVSRLVEAGMDCMRVMPYDVMRHYVQVATRDYAPAVSRPRRAG